MAYFSIAYPNKSRYDYDILSVGLPLQTKPLVSLLPFYQVNLWYREEAHRTHITYII